MFKHSALNPFRVALVLALFPFCLAGRAQAAPVLVFPFQVSWEILRSGFNNTLDVALEADTYAEEWVLVINSDDSLLLKTPHASVPVFGVKTSEGPNAIAPFDVLIVNEKDMAKIFGIQEDTTQPWGREIFLDFTSEGPEEQTLTFNANPKYFMSLTLRFQL